jgi:hypothetical protein
MGNFNTKLNFIKPFKAYVKNLLLKRESLNFMIMDMKVRKYLW